MNTVRIICRHSRLSLLQAEMVRQKIHAVQPNAEVIIISRSSRGDKELTVPLSSLDGTDFFTGEIFEALQNNEADIAVHSLKDMSANHFFSHTAFAIADRDDTRDVAIFNSTIEEKIKRGETIIIGTCSPRREDMAIHFLKKALPQLTNEITLETKSIRGNVESRLKQLHEGNYDGTILATAGLNRLLRSEQDAPALRLLLADKKLMLLPLIECVPAPCQGAIVAEADPSNQPAVELLKKINNLPLFREAFNEKKEAAQYGTGCLQKFGVTTLHTSNGNILYAAGEAADGTTFQKWTPLPQLEMAGKQLFSSTDCMKDFFDYRWNEEETFIPQPVIFIANYKAIQKNAGMLLSNNNLINKANSKTIFVSGTRTWLELAKQGHWITGSADALGVESFLPALGMPVFNIAKNDICLLTHREAALRWRQKGYQAVSNYALISKHDAMVAAAVSKADYLFWSSFSQYHYYNQYVKPGATHLCTGGETAALLKDAGIAPVIFPTIKAFEQWRKFSTRSHSVA